MSLIVLEGLKGGNKLSHNSACVSIPKLPCKHNWLLVLWSALDGEVSECPPPRAGSIRYPALCVNAGLHSALRSSSCMPGPLQGPAECLWPK